MKDNLTLYTVIPVGSLASKQQISTCNKWTSRPVRYTKSQRTYPKRDRTSDWSSYLPITNSKAATVSKL